MGRFLPFKELPQNILGYIISRLWKKRLIILTEKELKYLKVLEKEFYTKYKIFIADYYSHKSDKLLGFISGSSLGKYICLNSSHDTKTLRHEIGHCKQSEKFGWFYILIIGIPSACGNLFDRFFHKKWTVEKRIQWYYNQPWEKDADRRGGVYRS